MPKKISEVEFYDKDVKKRRPPSVGIEPTTLGVLDPCSNQQSYEGALEIAGVINNNKSTDITIQKPTNQLPRVQYIPLPATLPRVHQSKNLEPSQQSTPITALQTHSNLPKNLRFRNTIPHRYPLQNRNIGTNFRQLAANYRMATHLINPYHHAGFHIYRADGKRKPLIPYLKDKTKIYGQKA